MVRKIIKISLTTIGIILLLFIAVVGIAWYNQDKLGSLVLKKLNDSQEGHMQVSQIQIAPFRNFPYISIELDSLCLYATKKKDSPPIYSFAEAYIGFDVSDLLKGEYTMKKVLLKDGYIDFVKFEDGTINLLLAKSGEDDEEEESELSLDLQEVKVQNVLFKKTDHSSDQYIEVNLDLLNAKFAYRKNMIDIHLDGIGDLNEFMSSGVTFMSNKYLEIHTDVHYNLKSEFLKIDPSQFIVEKAKFEFEGAVSDLADSIQCDVKLKGQKNNFDMILSFAPEEYVDKLKSYKNEGDIFFAGLVKGSAGHGLTPQINFEFGCANAHFINPGQKGNLKDINFKGFYTNGEKRCLETSDLSIRNLTANPDNSVFKCSFRIRNFLDPLIYLDLHTRLDLDVLTQFYPIEGVDYVKGFLTVDMTLDELIDPDSAMVIITKLQDGTDSHISFDNVKTKLATYPHEIKVKEGAVEMVGDKIVLKNFNVFIKENTLSLTGEIDHLMSLIHNKPGDVRFTLTGLSKQLNLGELLAHDKKMAKEYNDVIRNLDFRFDLTSTSEELNNYKYLPKADLILDHLSFNTDKYPHKISNISGRMSFDDKLLSLKSLKASVGRNDLYITADIFNPEVLFDTLSKEEVRYKTQINSKYLNIKELMVYDGKCMLNGEIEEEVIQNFVFKGSGSFVSNSFCPNGFKSHTDIEYFTLKLNDFPQLKDVNGAIDTDVNGTVSIQNFTASMGRSDFTTTLHLEHYLDSNKTEKHIRGKFLSKRLDLDELLGYQPQRDDKVDHDSVFNIFALPFPDMELVTDIGELKHHKYLIHNFKGQFRSTPDHYVYLDKVSLDAADGNVFINGYFNGSNKDNIYFTSDIKLKNVDIDKVFYKFDNFGQDYMLNENLHGILDADIKSNVHMHTDLVVDLAKTTATADVKIREGRLVNFAPMHAMADYFGDKNLDNIRFGEMANVFEIKNGYLSFPSMKIASTLGYFYIAGNQDFDMNMDYEVKVPLQLVRQAGWSAAKSKFKKKKIEEKELEEQEEDIVDQQTGILKKYITVTIKGNSEDFDIKLGKKKNS
ncbi:MAG: AsmA-like C-terminal region-containing protein [Cytophagaceae bacterium]